MNKYKYKHKHKRMKADKLANGWSSQKIQNNNNNNVKEQQNSNKKGKRTWPNKANKKKQKMKRPNDRMKAMETATNSSCSKEKNSQQIAGEKSCKTKTENWRKEPKQINKPANKQTSKWIEERINAQATGQADAEREKCQKYTLWTKQKKK